MKLSLILILAILNFSKSQNEEIQVGLQNVLSEKAEIEGRIYGGQVASPGQFPYQVLVQGVIDHPEGYSSIIPFGGCLITTKAVLTSAEAMFDKTYFNIHLGAANAIPYQILVDADYSETYIPLNRVRVHSRFNAQYLQNNLAIIAIREVPSNILSLPSVGLIALPTASDASINLVGMNATISGYGVTSDENIFPTSLRYITAPIISNTDCDNLLISVISNRRFIYDENFCTSGTNGRNVCTNDGGSPVTVELSGRKVLIGITSVILFNGCTLGYPTGHTRITSYLDWIEEGTNWANEVSPQTTTTPSGAEKVSGGVFALISILILTIFK